VSTDRIHSASAGKRSGLRLVLILGAALALLISVALPSQANAGYANEYMSSPSNHNGHPRSVILLTGTCDLNVYCEARYKIQYSYWGWRNSGNSEVIVTPNQYTWTGAQATCNKSPGKYRGRLDIRYVNHETDGWTTTLWVRSSSPHSTIECK